MSVLKYFYFYRTPVVSVYVAAAADLQIGVTSQPCHQLTNIITYTPPSKFPQPNHGCHSMRQYIIAKTFNPINNSSCPVSHLSRPLHPKTTLSMNKIKHSLFRVISEILRSVIPTELHSCTKSVQFYLLKTLIINGKVYDKK